MMVMAVYRTSLIFAMFDLELKMMESKDLKVRSFKQKRNCNEFCQPLQLVACADLEGES